MTKKMVLAGVTLLSIATLANADSADVLNASVSYSWLRDDNLFRLADGTSTSHSRSDNIYTLGFVGTFDKVVSRQKLHADLNVRDVRYENNSYLNHQPYGAGISWGWVLGHNLSGSLGHRRTRSISSFETIQSTLKNTYDTRTNSASVRFRFHPDLAVEGGASNYDATQSLFSTSNLEVRERRAALIYFRPNGDEFHLRWIKRDGDYPNRTGGIDYGYNETQIDALMTMVFTGTSSMTASFGHLERNNPGLPARDFEGQIGRLALNWLPSGKLSLTAGIERSLGAREDIVSTFALTDRYNIGATWAATEKIRLDAGFEHWRSNYRGDPGYGYNGWVPQREDSGNTVTLGLSYEVVRNLVTAIHWTSIHRDSNYAAYRYRDELIQLSLQWSF